MSGKTTRKVVLSWSGGKDSLLTLERLREDGRWRVCGLLTTVSEDDGRSLAHGIPCGLIAQQAEAVGLPLTVVRLPAEPPNALYESKLGECLERLRGEGVTAAAFGDLFLDDVRRYREELLSRLGFEALFPLWGEDTRTLARRFLARGWRALVVVADGSQLDASFAGREFDESFLRDLPPHVDPCGERGEFHTFVYAGPLFGRAIRYRRGDVDAGERFARLILEEED